jgi:putative two-component system response regulator
VTYAELETLAAPGPDRVLVVDDHQALAGTIARWLRRAGLVCDIAHSPEEARTLARDVRYAIVFADIHMPGGSGLELARHLKAADPVVQVVLMTGNPAVEMAVEALRLDVDDYLVKPFERDVLLHSARRAGEHRRLRVENALYRSTLEARVREQSKRIERVYLSSVLALVTALEAKDPYTRGHSDRVAGYALALHDGVGGCDPEMLRIGAQLHDIGKIGVRSAILLKDGPLTRGETSHLARHPEVGVDILRPLLEGQDVLDVVLHHHERWDGDGYPHGLAGEDIPMGARIVAVADAFDAMTTIRPYRGARSPQQAVAELRAEAGRQFDPRVVAVASQALLEQASLAS